MTRPDWCPEDVWGRAFDLMDEHCASVTTGDDDAEAVVHAALARALLAAKREQQAEIDRLNKVIERMQSTMSSQAEQWTRSMAEAKREGMMDAATFLRDHATISNGETLDPAIPEILKALYQKAGDHRSGDDELIGTARQ